MEKMTYASALSTAIEVLSQSNEFDAAVEKLQALSASLAKRASYKSDKPSKAAREAAEFTQTVLEVVADNGSAMKCGDIAKALDVSGQKVSAALRKLVESGAVVKSTEKGVSLFSVPNEVEE